MNSKRFGDEAQVRSALGTTVPRKKMSEASWVSAVALAELMVKVCEAVPAMVVEAAEMLLALMLPT